MNKMNQLTSVAAAVLALSAMGLAHAGETIDFGDDLKLDWRVTTTYTAAQRMKSANPLLAGVAAGNDGDNNFAQNSLTANRVSLLFDGKLSKGASGLVLSASSFYDDVYHRTNDNPMKPFTVSKPAPFNEFTSEAQHDHGGYSRILDAYGYTAFDVGDSSRATVRLGRHVVNWGEAVYFPNIAMAQGPFDGTKAGVPGTETKDSVLPEDQISASLEVNPSWTLMAHAQFGFHPTIAPAPGSFMSTSDGVGSGGTCLGVYSGPTCFGFKRGTDITPGDSGQWGVGTRVRLTEVTEVGFYYLNARDRSPLPIIKPTSASSGSYNISYRDDVKLYGATLSTVLGSVAAYSELTFRQGAPILVGALATPKSADMTQWNVGGFANIGRMPIAESVQLLGEISSVVYSNYAVPVSGLNFKTDQGVAISGTLVLGYPGIFEGWDLTVPINYSQQLSGRTLAGGVGGEGDARYSVGAVFTYNGNLSLSATYLGYLGKESTDSLANRLVTDRDQLSLVAKYAF
jgi:hypothetical protein